MALTDDLISYWKLDEASGSALDAHGSNTLTDNNTVGSAAGKLGNARDFVAANTEYFSIADNASLSLGDVYFYAAGWFYITSDAATRTIFCKGNGTTQNEYALRWNSYSLRFTVASGSGFANETTVTHSATTLNINTWYFAECYHDPVANLIMACINRGTDSTTSYTHGVFDGANAFELGREGGGGRHWSGRLDEWYFRKGSLPTTAERNSLYGSGTPPGYDSFGGGVTLVQLERGIRGLVRGLFAGTR